jgi:hypothetical protein
MGEDRSADPFPGFDNAMTTTPKKLTTPGGRAWRCHNPTCVDTHAAYKEMCVSTPTHIPPIGWQRYDNA